MNFKVISRNVGFALLVSAFFMLCSLIVAVCNPGDTSSGPLAISFLITFIASCSSSSSCSSGKCCFT